MAEPHHAYPNDSDLPHREPPLGDAGRKA